MTDPMTRIFRRSVIPRLAASLLSVAFLLHVSAGRAPAGDLSEDGVTAAHRTAEEVRAHLTLWSRNSRAARGVEIVDPLLAERVATLRQTSPTFDAAWRELERSRVSLVVGTDEQLRDFLPRHVRDQPWAGLTLSWGDGLGTLQRGAVAIRRGWLEDLHDAFGNPNSAFLQALDHLLIHEIYGHLVPVVAARNTRASCADPGPLERLEESCVGRRELAIRAEITKLALGD